jgi:hypothetical protein
MKGVMDVNLKSYTLTLQQSVALVNDIEENDNIWAALWEDWPEYGEDEVEGLRVEISLRKLM